MALEHWARACPKRFTGATWQLVTESPAPQGADPAEYAAMVEQLGAWLEKPYGNVVIFGALGAGKTLITTAMCHELAMTKGLYSEFALEQRFFDDCRPDGRGIDFYTRPQVLVLDDIGTGRATMTEFEEGRLYLLMAERWQNRQITAMTTNLAPEVFRTYLGERIRERVVHESLAIKLDGASRRTQRWEAS
jgi:DNA replication protein DnaC